MPRSLAGYQVPHPPEWVASLPLVGEKVAQFWEQAVAEGSAGMIARLVPYADDIAKWFVSQAGSFGFVFLQFLLTVAISALMYAGGETRGSGSASVRTAPGGRERRATR